MAQKRKKKTAKKRLQKPSKKRVSKRRTPKTRSVEFASPAVARFCREHQSTLLAALKHHSRGAVPPAANPTLKASIVGFYDIKGRLLSLTTDIGKRRTVIAFV